MDGTQSGPKDSSAAATSQKASHRMGVTADEREIRIQHYPDGEKCQDQYVPPIVECVSILADTAREILEYLKEQHGSEHVATMLCGAIHRVEQVINNSCPDLDKFRNKLCTIEEEICHIKQAICLPDSALEEIKREINWIGKQVPKMKGFCPNVTSGSVIVEDPQSTQVLVAVKNTTATARTVRVRVMRDDICPARELADKCLLVSGCCSNAITVHFDTAAAYEIEVFDLVPGMTVSSIELDICKRLIKCSRLTAAQFVCREEMCP